MKIFDENFDMESESKILNSNNWIISNSVHSLLQETKQLNDLKKILYKYSFDFLKKQSKFKPIF